MNDGGFKDQPKRRAWDMRVSCRKISSNKKLLSKNIRISLDDCSTWSEKPLRCTCRPAVLARPEIDNVDTLAYLGKC